MLQGSEQTCESETEGRTDIHTDTHTDNAKTITPDTSQRRGV